MKIGFFGLLQLIFITLKLIDKIDWSWWWVLAPTWAPFLLFIGFMVAVAVIGLCRAWRKSREATKSELYHD